METEWWCEKVFKKLKHVCEMEETIKNNIWRLHLEVAFQTNLNDRKPHPPLRRAQRGVQHVNGHIAKGAVALAAERTVDGWASPTKSGFTVACVEVALLAAPLAVLLAVLSAVCPTANLLRVLL